MATQQQVLKAVKVFATKSGIFTTPRSIDDPIKPSLAPGSLSDTAFVHVFQDFHTSLLIQGIKTSVPIDAMRDAETWGDLGILAFDNQQV